MQLAGSEDDFTCGTFLLIYCHIYHLLANISCDIDTVPALRVVSLQLRRVTVSRHVGKLATVLYRYTTSTTYIKRTTAVGIMLLIFEMTVMCGTDHITINSTSSVQCTPASIVLHAAVAP